MYIYKGWFIINIEILYVFIIFVSVVDNDVYVFIFGNN